MEILSVRGVVPEHRYTQEEITDAFAGVIAEGAFDERLMRRFHANAGVEQRYLAMPLEEYGTLDGFGTSNDRFIEVGVQLGAQAVVDALKAADLTPADVDLIISTTVTGLAVPSLDARIAAVIGLRPDVKRVPLGGLGCVAGGGGGGGAARPPPRRPPEGAGGGSGGASLLSGPTGGRGGAEPVGPGG